jgi:hypothetical protein
MLTVFVLIGLMFSDPATVADVAPLAFFDSKEACEAALKTVQVPAPHVHNTAIGVGCVELTAKVK